MNGELPKSVSEADGEGPERQAERDRGLLVEFWEFLLTNKRWWLVPILLSILLFVVLVVLSRQDAQGPWIYSLF